MGTHVAVAPQGVRRSANRAVGSPFLKLNAPPNTSVVPTGAAPGREISH